MLEALRSLRSRPEKYWPVGTESDSREEIRSQADESQLSWFFATYGTVEEVKLVRDHVTNNRKGYARSPPPRCLLPHAGALRSWRLCPCGKLGFLLSALRAKLAV